MADNWKLWSDRVNTWRLIPRLLIALYGYMAYQVAIWFMGLPDPSGPQVTFVSTIWGAAAAWFGFYVNSGVAKVGGSKTTAKRVDEDEEQ